MRNRYGVGACLPHCRDNGQEELVGDKGGLDESMVGNGGGLEETVVSKAVGEDGWRSGWQGRSARDEMVVGRKGGLEEMVVDREGDGGRKEGGLGETMVNRGRRLEEMTVSRGANNDRMVVSWWLTGEEMVVEEAIAGFNCKGALIAEEEGDKQHDSIAEEEGDDGVE
ncbi:hypothetical protein ACLOJK_009499 [Asimina triloba]